MDRTDDCIVLLNMIFRSGVGLKAARHQAAISPLQMSLIVVSCHEDGLKQTPCAPALLASTFQHEAGPPQPSVSIPEELPEEISM